MGLAPLDDPVFHARRDKKGNCDDEQGEAGAEKCLRQERKLCELLLEYAVELKAQQNLGAENEQTRFVKRDLELAFKLHGPQQVSRHVRLVFSLRLLT